MRIDTFEGLLIDYTRRQDITVVVKGLRVGEDATYELAMAHMNRRAGGIETLLMPAAPQLSFVSSSLVKQVALGGGDVAGLVPEPVLRALQARLVQPV